MSNDLLRSGGIGQRPLYNLGGNFPIEPEALGSLLAQYLCQTEPELSIDRPEEVVAVMTPHIDHYRGAPVYASCARVLEAIPRPDLIVLMGTHHNEDAASLFHVDNRDMISPLGCAPCAIGAVEYLCSRFSHFPSFETTYAELDQEWSLEMTLPILQHRFRNEQMPVILPITIGWMKSFLRSNREPCESDEIRSFILLLGQMLSEMHDAGMRVLLWNAVDFSHVGTWHGDTEPHIDRFEDRILQKDRQVLEVLNSGDEQRLFETFAADNNKYRSDVFEPLYVMLAALRAARGYAAVGQTIDYELTARIERRGHSEWDNIVSFGATYWR